MSEKLFHQDGYLAEAPALVTAHSPEGGVILDRSIFYPLGGGQPGDSGSLTWDGGALPISTTIKGKDQTIILVPGASQYLPPVGTAVTQVLDWDRRCGHMRIHTALHLQWRWRCRSRVVQSVWTRAGWILTCPRR